MRVASIRILIAAGIFLLAAHHVHAQGWSAQTSGTSNTFFGTSFADGSNGWAVGASGTIVHTANGGTTWASQTSGTSNTLWEVFFTDANTGTAVGDGGTIRRTTNGGTTWTSQSSGVSTALLSVHFSSTNTGTAVGNGGVIRRTTNGGTSWAGQTSGTSTNLWGIYFTDVNAGTAVGENGVIRRTTNGGTNWNAQTSGTSVGLWEVFFRDANNGWAVGDNGTIIHTTNAGTTWTSQSSGTTNALYHIFFTDLNKGTAGGASGIILRTTNGGSTWSSQSSGTSNNLHEVVFTSATEGWMVGAGGTILHTTTSGVNCGTITISPASLPSGTVGNTYSQTLTASGGAAPYVFVVSSGSLPAGLNLSSAGLLSGTPTTSGSSSFSIRATDDNGCTGSRSYVLTINCVGITLSPAIIPNGTVDAAYTQTVTASGGTAPYTFSVTSGSLPPGLTLSSGGVLSGTPTAAGNFTFTVTATDAQGCTVNGSYTVTIFLTITPSTLPGGTVGTVYSQTCTASGGTGPYAFTIQSGSLPPGLMLSSSGVISGTPTTIGSYTFTVGVVDAGGRTGSRTYTIVIGCPAIALAPSSLPPGVSGVLYSQTITASGGTAPYVFAVSSGTLPVGIALSSTGLLSGTPTAAGTSTFTITATDAQGCTTSTGYSVTVSLAISPGTATLPDGTVGVSYHQTLTASGGTSPYGFVVTTGALPPGLTLSSLGDISGVPTTIGTYSFTVTVSDPSANTGSQSYSITINCPTITLNPSSLPNGVANSSYSQTVTTSGGTAPITYVVTSGALAAGISLSSAGILSGTPTTVGSSTFTITATDAQGCTGSRSYAMTIECPVINLSPTGLPNGIVGSSYSQTISGNGGTPPYGYGVTAGSLPSGLTLTSSGFLSGTPSSAGTFSFTVTATDVQGCTGTRNYSLRIDCPLINLNPSSLSTGIVGSSYSQTISAGGGTVPYSFSTTSGTLPTGLTLSLAGLLSGVPTAVGNFNFTMTATDAQGCTGNRSYTVTIACPTITVTPISLPHGIVGSSYGQAISASGGTAPYSFGLTAGALPAGLAFSPSGALSGIPTTVGTSSFTVIVTDAQGCTGTRGYSIVVDCPAIALSPSSLPNGTAGSPYGQSILGSGGTAPYTFARSAGLLPAGLTLSAAGVVSGNPTTVGTSSFTITATDAQGCAGSVNYTITIDCPVITVSPASLPNGIVGVSYGQTVSGSGGTLPYDFAVTSGALPGGLTLSSSGIISGTPNTAGSFTFEISATDAQGCVGVRSYTLSISCPSIVLSPTTLPNGIAHSSYSQTLTASGGTSPYSFSVTAGAMPPGLSLLSTGILSGTPTTIGSYTVTVTATDANACQGNRSYTITINCGAITISPLTFSNGSVGGPYSETLTASGGTSPYGFAVTGGSLPAGLTLSGSGTLSGTPTVVGVSSFTISATDAQGCVSSRDYSVTVDCPSIVLTPATLPNGVVSTSYGQTISGSGGTAPYSFSVTTGSLPNGLTLSSAGLISGTPTLAGGFTFTITATDAQACSNDHTYTVSINCPTITLSPATLPNGIVGSAYLHSITSGGGTAPYTFTVIADALPPGLSLSTAGLISGTPTTVGAYPVTIRATDAQGCAGSQSYGITIDCPTINLAPTSLAHGTVGVTYNQVITPSGGTAPYGFSVSSGSLPSGVTLSSLGNLSGIPTTVGTYTFGIMTTDNQECPGSRSYTLIIDCPVISMNPSSLADGRVGISYDHTITATGGTAPYGFSILSGSLPSGLALLPSGALTGTPTTVGTFTFTVRAMDAQACTGSKSYTVTIECPSISLNPSALPDGIVGSSYSQTLTASGGTAAYSFGVTSGSLPIGLSLSSAGVLSGVPAGVGTYAFTVTATDAQGCLSSNGYMVTINCPPITIAPPILANGTVGSSYSQSIVASGGTSPYVFTVTSGSLPAGLSLSPGGVVSGTPAVVGSFSVSVTATDAQGCFGSKTYNFDISCPAITLTPGSLPHGIVGALYGQSLGATGGRHPYTFSLFSGNLPSGLALSPSGSISGTPATAGPSTFILLAVDSLGCSGTRTYTLVIDAPGFSVAPSSLTFGNVVVGSNRTDSLTVTNTGTSVLTISLVTSSASEFSVLPQTANLTAGSSKKFYVTLSPTSAGAKNATIVFTHDASGSPTIIGVSGIGVLPIFSLSPINVYYGNVNVGSTKPDSITITNIGSSALTISSVLSSNLQFAVTPASVVLSPGGRQKYSVAFTPTSTGTKTGNVTFTHDASGSPSAAGLNGVGVIRGFTITPRVNFGNVVVGSSKQDSMTIVNTGTLTLNITSVMSTDPWFGVTPANGSIPPGGSKRFFITFTPASTGSRTASIVYAHDAPGTPDSLAVSGTGVAPGFFITPAQLQFANTIVGTSQIDSITVSNPGTSLLSISRITSSNSMFTVIPTSGTILPAASRKFYVTFRPTVLGDVSAVLSLAHDASGSPAAVPISGTGTASISIVKIRDSDGNAATTYDQSLTKWHLALYRTSVSPANLIAEGDTSMLTVGVSQADTYIATETDRGYPWVRINGNRSAYDTLSVAFGTSIADTFINVEQNTIVARVFEDTDGDFQTTGDRVPKSWHVEVYQGTGPGGPLVASGTGTSLSVPTLGDGSYYVRTSDSSSWVPLGYLVNGIPTSTSNQSVTIAIAGGQSATVDFIVAPPIYGKMFRTFTPEGLAQKKGIKKKPVSESFCAQFVNATGTTADGLQMEGKSEGLGIVITEITNSDPFPSRSSPDGRVWMFNGANVRPGQTVTVCGIFSAPHATSIKSWNWVVNGVAQARQPGFTPPGQQKLYPMPNFANVRDEVFLLGGFSASGGLVVGEAKGADSARKYGWVRIRSSRDMQRSLMDRTGYHTPPARGFDEFSNHKAFIKEQKTLPPQKQRNVLFANLVGLHFAITASAMGITPTGLGELIYEDTTGGGTNRFNGMMVKDIASYADHLLMGYYQGNAHKFAGGSEYAGVNAVTEKVNEAFAGSMDTSSFVNGLIVKGVKRLVDVPYLRANPGVTPDRILPLAIKGDEGTREVPGQYVLSQNYPNPFNPTTTISFSVPEEALVTLKVYNMLGQEVATVLDREQVEEGETEIEFGAAQLASGVYFYRMTAEGLSTGDEGENRTESPGAHSFTQVRKMVLVK